VTGTAARGKKLTCEPGSWSGTPSLTYEWLRDGAPIRHQTEHTYRLRGRDVGHLISCRVTAHNNGGTAVATSAVVPAPTPPGDFGMPAPDKCAGSRGLRMRLKLPAALRSSTVGVYVDGQRRLSVRGRSLPGVVWVRRLPAKRFGLSVRAVTVKGAWAHAARSYKRCD